MVWAGVCYGQRTQVHFIDGILNAQRYRDEILRPIVVPFIHDHQTERIINKLFLGGKHNFATSTCFLRFDGQLLNPDFYLMKVITEVESLVITSSMHF